MVSITIRKNGTEQPYYDIKPGFELKLATSDSPLYAKITPPLLYRDTPISRLLVDKIICERPNELVITPPFNTISFTIPRECNSMIFDIVDPDTEPINSIINPLMNDPNFIYYISLFQVETSKCIGTIFEVWKSLPLKIKTILEKHGYPSKNIRIGYENIPATFADIENFFSEAPKMTHGRLFLNLYFDSDNEDAFELDGKKISLKNTPELPKKIAQICRLNMTATNYPGPQAAIWRRLAVAAINCGVVLPYLEKVEMSGINLKEFDIGTFVFDLCKIKAEDKDRASLYGSELGDLRKFVTSTSNEATWCSNFWFPFINRCFELIGGSINYKIAFEVGTRAHLHEGTNKKIDCAVTVNIQNGEFPILIVEADKETVSPGAEHKIYGMLAWSSYNFAYSLARSGLRPELGITYGMLIGGSKCQLLVAQPVVRSVPGTNEYEIYINISYHDHWNFDIHTGPATSPNCREPCCYCDKNNTHASTFLNRNGTNETIKCLEYFINTVKAQIDNVFNSESNRDTLNRKFVPRRDQASFSSARGSSTGESPQKGKIKPAIESSTNQPTESTSSSPLTKKQRKSSSFEANVYTFCSAYYGSVFPRLYQVDQVNTTEGPAFDYTFELLTPFYRKNGDFSLPDLFDFDDSAKFISEVFRFSSHCLYGLHILHERLKIVHSDVKISNIMYSKLDSAWKLIDFDHSMSIEESAAKSRKAGTRDYWAPECPEGLGTFTSASDIFSFGVLVEEIFFYIILNFLIYADESNNEFLRSACSQVFDLIDAMKKDLPEDRPTAIEALQIALAGLKFVDPFGSVSDGIIVSATNLIKLKSQEKLQSESNVELFTEESFVKRPRTEHKKDVVEKSIENIIQ